MAIYDVDKLICYARGDTRPITFQRKENGVVFDVSGFTFQFTVNTERDPVNTDNEQFSVAGVITDAPNGLYEFRPSAVETDLIPDRYYYDVQQIDGGGFIHTLVKAPFVIEQDIDKA